MGIWLRLPCSKEIVEEPNDFFSVVRFDSLIGSTPGRREVLLPDNCSAHENIDYLPTLLHVHVLFLPKNTTARLQPLDGGIIASLKKLYKKPQVQRAIHLIDNGITQNLYDYDIRIAVQNICEDWYRLDSIITRNCRRKIGTSDDDVDLVAI